MTMVDHDRHILLSALDIMYQTMNDTVREVEETGTLHKKSLIKIKKLLPSKYPSSISHEKGKNEKNLS